MQWLASVSVRRPVFATVLVLAVCVLGIVSYFNLGVDRFPKVGFPVVSVVTRLPGATPQGCFGSGRLWLPRPSLPIHPGPRLPSSTTLPMRASSYFAWIRDSRFPSIPVRRRCCSPSSPAPVS